jgi:predicted transcriptional regulator
MPKLSDDQIEKLKTESPEYLIKLARTTGRTDKQIVRELTYLASDEGVAAAARKFASALGMTEAEFKVMAGAR